VVVVRTYLVKHHELELQANRKKCNLQGACLKEGEAKLAKEIFYLSLNLLKESIHSCWSLNGNGNEEKGRNP